MDFVRILVLIVYIQHVHGFFDPYQFQDMDAVTSEKYCGSSGCNTSSVPSESATTDDGKLVSN